MGLAIFGFPRHKCSGPKMTRLQRLNQKHLERRTARVDGDFGSLLRARYGPTLNSRVWAGRQKHQKFSKKWISKYYFEYKSIKNYHKPKNHLSQ